ncbi:drug:proton antiporter [Streptomyces sp. PBH53]|uniref:geranylgeranyl reductase family protein n=1 Tax=Streptomyces TaxID=1883 RepID=UPI000655D948|nr:geranylgeranyl reductase family protein [Streptomyces sp. PBH53]AKN74685.1 drug:proton antiporter [Streptomyces sp. PBH53]
MSSTQAEETADVIVVGAGPAGSTTAFYLAQAGLDVLLLEKAHFPRDKICGDGLTPRAVKELLTMGVDVRGSGWVRSRGLRACGAGLRVEMDWPDITGYPGFGLVRTRQDFDHLLAARAQAAGARLHEGTNVTDILLDERTGHARGVVARRDGVEHRYGARLVVAADGASSRVAVRMGLQQRKDRTMGVAVRRYYATDRTSDDYLECWLDLPDPASSGRRSMLYGYGWLFPVGNGMWNVGVGTVSVHRRPDIDHRALLRDWTARLPEERQIDEDHATTAVRGHALPGGMSRTPQYTRGVLLAGDAAGLINPLSGEGIDYAMESGRFSAEVIVQALARSTASQCERALNAYPQLLKDAFGGYFTLGRLVVQALGNPHLMKFVTAHSLRRPAVARMMFKLWCNLIDPRSNDAADRVMSAVLKATPAP